MSVTSRDARTKRLDLLVTVATVAAIAFVILAIAFALHPQPSRFEAALDRAFFAAHGTVAFDLFHIVTITGSFAFVAAGAAVLSVECWRHSRDLRLAVACILGPGLAGVAEIALKPVIGRPRPSTSVLTGESGFGFPSGHAAGATALAVCAIAVAWALIEPGRTRAVVIGSATAYAVVIGVSRVVVGAHHAGDVVGGCALGVAIACGTLAVLQPTSLVARPSEVPGDLLSPPRPAPWSRARSAVRHEPLELAAALAIDAGDGRDRHRG